MGDDDVHGGEKVKKVSVKVKVLRIESPAMGCAMVVCEIDGKEVSVPMSSGDKDPKEAIEKWFDSLARWRRESQTLRDKTRGWEGKELEVEVRGE